ncbi:MAG: SDR family NAD(P)-dependent oxidoreductase, partial [Vicinamibacterales bacterium]
PPAVEAPETASLGSAADLKRALIVRLEAAGGRVTPGMVERAYRQLLKERELRETIGAISATGARLHYVALDVTDAAAFGALIEQIYEVYGRLDGILHGAGIIEDKLVRDKTPESFTRVVRTKTRSAFVLSRHVRPETLRFAVFFSSVAGRFGNRGQADYAAANEIVSRLAVLLQRTWAARVCAIAWAPWDKLGMVSPELKREFARRGVELLTPSAGRRALWQEIQQGRRAAAEVVIGGHAATPLTTGHSRERLPLLKGSNREVRPDGTRFERIIDPSTDLYLNDHRLDGHPVLPLAFATELMAEAGQAAWPELQVVAVRDLQLLKGLVIDAPLPVVITVRSAVHSSDDGLTEVDVEITTPTIAPLLRYRSVVQLSANPAPPTGFEEPAWPLAPLSKTIDRAYRDWTFHGPLFQRVTAIAGICDDAVLGTIYSSSAIPALAGVDRPDWIIDPFVFDCALQLLLIWSRATADKTALPSRFGRFTRYGSLADQPLTTYVAVESLAGGHALRSDVHFVDARGQIVGVLSGMEANCTRALNRLGQS